MRFAIRLTGLVSGAALATVGLLVAVGPAIAAPGTAAPPPLAEAFPGIVVLAMGVLVAITGFWITRPPKVRQAPAPVKDNKAQKRAS